MLLKPKIKLERITDISLELLEQYGIDSLLLDVDNTMSTHHGTILTDGLTEWIEKMQKGNIKLCVVSNSKEFRVCPFAGRIGLDYVSLALKPLPFGFIKGVKKVGSKRKSTAIVGDQIFTDIIGGNAVGVKTILLTPIKPEDGWSFKLRRWLEKIVFKVYKIENLNK